MHHRRTVAAQASLRAVSIERSGSVVLFFSENATPRSLKIHGAPYSLRTEALGSSASFERSANPGDQAYTGLWP